MRKMNLFSFFVGNYDLYISLPSSLGQNIGKAINGRKKIEVQQNVYACFGNCYGFKAGVYLVT